MIGIVQLVLLTGIVPVIRSKYHFVKDRSLREIRTRRFEPKTAKMRANGTRALAESMQGQLTVKRICNVYSSFAFIGFIIKKRFT